MLRVLADRGTEYDGAADRHDYQLYMAVNEIDDMKTKVKFPQTNGICERVHKTVLLEFYQVAFRKKIYESIEDLQADLDNSLTTTMPRGPIGERCAPVERQLTLALQEVDLEGRVHQLNLT